MGAWNAEMSMSTFQVFHHGTLTFCLIILLFPKEAPNVLQNGYEGEEHLSSMDALQSVELAKDVSTPMQAVNEKHHLRHVILTSLFGSSPSL